MFTLLVVLSLALCIWLAICVISALLTYCWWLALIVAILFAGAFIDMLVIKHGFRKIFKSKKK